MRTRTLSLALALLLLAPGVTGSAKAEEVAPTSTPGARTVKPSQAPGGRPAESVSTRPLGLLPAPAEPTAVPYSGHITSTGMSGWHAAGITGAGVKVGIIDYFDASIWTDHLGAFPDAGHRRCLKAGVSCDATFFTGMGGGEHGVAVAEVLLEAAPGVELFIGTAATTSDTRALVDWFASKGVRIISRSLIDFYDGPGDGRGPLAEVVDHAAALGMLWVNAAGNQGVNSYYRGFSKDSNNNGVIEFGPGADEFLRIDGCAVLGGLRWHTDWDVPPAQRQDYDLYVYTAPTTSGTPTVNLSQPVYVSDRDQRGQFGPPQDPLEGVGAALLCPPAGHSHYVRIERFAGPRDDFDVLELLVHPVVGSVSIEYVSSTVPAAHSATLPVVDSRSRSLLAVGSTTGPTSTSVAAFSNRGPTNDGRVKPDLVAPACLPSSIYEPCFAGTSASAPMVAGAGALLLQAGLAAPGRPLAAAIKHRTYDLQPPGADNASGWGLLGLGLPPISGIDSSPGRYTPLANPTRVFDTRPASAVGPSALIGELAVDEIRRLGVTGKAGVPASGVSAVAVNITTVRPLEPGYVQALPAHVQGSAVGGFSNLNVDQPGRTVANFAIVPVGVNGAIDLYSASGGHLVVDVLGWFGPSAATSSGRFVGLDPARALDTRPGAGQRVPAGWNPAHKPTSGDSIRVPVPASSGVPTDGTVSALVLNVTATAATAAAVVQAYPTGSTGTIGTTSTLNVQAGRTVANSVIVPLGTDGTASLYLDAVGGGSAHLIADVTGYITSASAVSATAGRFVPVGPGRVYDSRTSGGRFMANEMRTRPVAGAAGPTPVVPVGATAAALNLTVTGSLALGYLSVWPEGTPVPATSNLNWPAAGSTVANAALVKLSPGGSVHMLSASNATSGPLAHHLIDVFGWFTA